MSPDVLVATVGAKKMEQVGQGGAAEVERRRPSKHFRIHCAAGLTP